MRCGHWIEDRSRCRNDAGYALFDQNGKRVPSLACREHAEAVLDEYALKINWIWEARRVDEYGELVEGGEVLRPRWARPNQDGPWRWGPYTVSENRETGEFLPCLGALALSVWQRRLDTAMAVCEKHWKRLSEGTI